MENTRTSLVTGGTGGIGRAVALRLAQGGDRVLITGRNATAGAEVVARLRQAAPGLDHDYLPADLSLLDDTSRLAEATQRRTDRLDAVVCCAGVPATVPEWTPENLERAFVLNYLSRYLLARQLLPALTAAGPARRRPLRSADRRCRPQHGRSHAGLARPSPRSRQCRRPVLGGQRAARHCPPAAPAPLTGDARHSS